MALSRMNIRGTWVDVEAVSAEDGTGTLIFSGLLNGERYTAPDWKGLERKLLAISKGQKVAVPFYSPDQDDLGVATGIHQNRNVLVRWADGKAAQLGSYQADRCFRHMTLDELAEWRQLVQAERDAQSAVRLFRRGHEIKLRDMVRNAVRAMEQEPDDAVPDDLG